jgi:MoxR-like ATPase
MYEVKRVVVGQDAFLERVLIALLAQGHLLIEGVPGLAKTLTVNTLAKTLNGTFSRIQSHPIRFPPTWSVRVFFTSKPANSVLL